MSTSIVLVDSTVRLRWEMTKAEFDNCEFGQHITSPVFTPRILLRHQVEHQGVPQRKQCSEQKQGDLCDAQLPPAASECQVEKEGGYWPNDNVKDLYALNVQRKSFVFNPALDSLTRSECRILCETKDFIQRFHNNKIAVVATLVIYGAGVNYLDHEEAAKDYVTNMRSVPDFESLTNITIVCEGKRFKCQKTVLAAMSTYFRAKFTQNFKDKNAKVIKIDDSTAELVEQMIDFMNYGLIPKNIKDTAGELIKMSTFYGIEALTKVCENALIKNLSSENAISTFLSFDKYVPLSDQRKKIPEFIKTKRKKIVKSEDWEMFCTNHPNLVAEILEAI